jgi:hypothetical protein
MSDAADQPPAPAVLGEPPRNSTREPHPASGPFFQRIDCRSRCTTTIAASTVYVGTLGPYVTLRYSGTVFIILDQATQHSAPRTPLITASKVYLICGEPSGTSTDTWL